MLTCPCNCNLLLFADVCCGESGQTVILQIRVPNLLEKDPSRLIKILLTGSAAKSQGDRDPTEQARQWVIQDLRSQLYSQSPP